MKLACRVAGHPGLIVGYANAKRSKVWAIVITQGELRPVRLRDIELLTVPAGLEKVVPAAKPMAKPKVVASA